jgi:hypothetical protein
MKKSVRTTLILGGSLASLALSLYFGLNTHAKDLMGMPTDATDWGRVALALVFGSVGCVGIAALLRQT